jgi:putative membrane protein
MWSIFLSGLATALSLLVVDLIVPGVRIDTITAAAIAAASVGLVNAFIKPILQTVSVPITVVTFGFFALVVNGLCFWLSSLFVPGFYVKGILGFLLGPVVLSFVSTALGNYLDKKAPAFMRDSNNDLLRDSGDLSTDSTSQP